MRSQSAARQRQCSKSARPQSGPHRCLRVFVFLCLFVCLCKQGGVRLGGWHCVLHMLAAGASRHAGWRLVPHAAPQLAAGAAQLRTSLEGAEVHTPNVLRLQRRVAQGLVL